jgi:hypothetical protein
MSKKSRKRNKKILGALAAGLGAMALMKGGTKGNVSKTAASEDANVGINTRPSLIDAQDAGTTFTRQPRVPDRITSRLRPSVPKKKVWTGDQTMAPNRSIWRAEGGRIGAKHGGSVTGAAKRGFGRALMKGKK